jgi:hypothetical protein
MIDPNTQALNRQLDKEARFNRALEGLIPVVLNDYIFFEGFIMDEDEYSFNHCEDLREMHKQVLAGKHELSMLFCLRAKDEAVRRINA